MQEIGDLMRNLDARFYGVSHLTSVEPILHYMFSTSHGIFQPNSNVMYM